MTSRDPKPGLDARVTELLRSMPAERPDSDWEAQASRILARLGGGAVANSELDVLRAPFPEPAPDPAEHPEGRGAVPALRASRAPRREAATSKPGFTWLLASVVALAAAAVIVIRVRTAQTPAAPQAEPPVALPAGAELANEPLAVAPAPERPVAARPPESAPPVPGPVVNEKPRALARATRQTPLKTPTLARGASPAPAETAELEPDPRLKPADGRQPLMERPSPGALTAALDKVLPSARACLTAKSAPVPAEIVFGSDGNVLRVSVGPGASAALAGCVRGALSRARVEPFSRPSWSVRSTVRPR